MYPQDGSHVMEGSYDRMQASSSTISTSTVTTKDPSRSFSVRNQFSFPQLEYDTDRAGSFEPLKFLPLNKTVVLGVVSTKIPQVCSMAVQISLNALTMTVHGYQARGEGSTQGTRSQSSTAHRSRDSSAEQRGCLEPVSPLLPPLPVSHESS